MLAKVYSGAVVGLEGQLVEVEVDLLGGLPRFNVVGLPDTSVTESRERVKSAIRNSGFLFPTKVITASLAPADVKKEGPTFEMVYQPCGAS
jgi:magnesium chelatase family protein